MCTIIKIIFEFKGDRILSPLKLNCIYRKEFFGKKTMRNLFRIYLLYLILFINITFWSCDSKIEPLSTMSEKLPPPNDSTIVFVTIGGEEDWGGILQFLMITKKYIIFH